MRGTDACTVFIYRTVGGKMAAEFEMVEFHPKHIECMDVRKDEKETLLANPKAYDYIEMLANNGKAGTILYDGRILTVIGYVPMFENTYEIWQIPSIYTERYPLVFCKAILYFLKKYMYQFKFDRISTTCPADELHDRWMRFLRFNFEGTAKKYAYGRDFNVWAKYGE